MPDTTLEHIRDLAAAVRDEDWEAELAAAAAITAELGEAQHPRTAVALAQRFRRQHRPRLSLPPEIGPSLFAQDWNAAREAAQRIGTLKEARQRLLAGGTHVMVLGGRVLRAELPVPAEPAPVPTPAELAREELLGLLEAIDDGDGDVAMMARALVAEADLPGMAGGHIKSALDQFTLALAHLRGATTQLRKAMEAEPPAASDQTQAAALGLPADAISVRLISTEEVGCCEDVERRIMQMALESSLEGRPVAAVEIGVAQARALGLGDAERCTFSLSLDVEHTPIVVALEVLDEPSLCRLRLRAKAPATEVAPSPLHEGTNADDALATRQREREALFAVIRERVEVAQASGRAVNTVELGRREQAILGEPDGTTWLQLAPDQPWLTVAWVKAESALSLYRASPPAVA